MSRPRALTMPAVTEPPRPNGLPMAITQSPTRSALLSPNETEGSGCPASTLSTARSTRVSVPMTFALSVMLSCSVTVISSAFAIT